MIVGYARVSTEDQNLELQTDALQKAGCEVIKTDKASGAREDRPGLESALGLLNSGDTLIVWKLDRLGRSVKHLIEVATALRNQGVHFKSVKDNIDTSTVTGRFFFNVMASFAEMEKELIQERTKAGLAAAKDRGRIGGRPKRMTPSKLEAAERLLIDGIPIKDVARSLEISVPTLYRYFPISTMGINGQRSKK